MSARGGWTYSPSRWPLASLVIFKNSSRSCLSPGSPLAAEETDGAGDLGQAALRLPFLTSSLPPPRRRPPRRHSPGRPHRSARPPGFGPGARASPGTAPTRLRHQQRQPQTAKDTASRKGKGHPLPVSNLLSLHARTLCVANRSLSFPLKKNPQRLLARLAAYARYEGARPGRCWILTNVDRVRERFQRIQQLGHKSLVQPGLPLAAG